MKRREGTWSHTLAVGNVRLHDRTPRANPSELYSMGHKRMKMFNEGKDTSSTSWIARARERNYNEEKTPSKVIDYSDPFAVPDLLEGLDSGKYGSVTEEIESLCNRKMRMLNPLFALYPSLSYSFADSALRSSGVGLYTSDLPDKSGKDSPKLSHLASQDIIDLEDESIRHSVVILDSDEEDDKDFIRTRQEQVNASKAVEAYPTPSYQYQEVILSQSIDPNLIRDLVDEDCGEREESNHHQSENEDDGLEDIWKEMTLALECSKDVVTEVSAVEHDEEEEEEDCDHSFVLKDDLGYVCRVCGVIERRIETIFDFQWPKGSKTTRTYFSESRDYKDKEQRKISELKVSEHDLPLAEISLHPRHMKQMKPHQLEGFNFLVKNLVSDNPGGCILAHAPGSGKTFMIISFMQSFLAKYPHARPLVVLPKGILATWKKEFQRWQVEDIPLYDFYSSKAEKRSLQLDILSKWVEHKSILFLGYKQFASIVSDRAICKITDACKDILLKVPSILILDEGHTPRNEDTDILHSLAKIQTPRKVVLSGTLYQNHVYEVFNILDLVRSKFLKSDTSRAVKRRILSIVQISRERKMFKTDNDSLFFDLVEYTLEKDEDFKRKVTVIQELRNMTCKVLHYYKGDFLEELPGLVDFTVLLNLRSKQKQLAEKLMGLKKFKRSSVGSAVYLHPHLKEFSENALVLGDEKIDDLVEKIDVKDGVKAKFFLNILGLCESAKEKLLVFSQYLLPLKFLERLAVKTKGWSPGKEIFVISGDSSPENREWSMERFNNSSDAKVFFGSIKACGEGISLVGASRILILDVHLNPSVTRQAIGRAFRPGQTKKVYTYRLVAADSPEEEDHETCFRKELISKMWFEWNEYCGQRNFKMETVDLDDSEDLFLESPILREDVKVLYKR